MNREAANKSSASADAHNANAIQLIDEFFTMNDFPEIMDTLNQLLCNSITPREGCAFDRNHFDNQALNLTQTTTFLSRLYKLHRENQ